MTQEFKVAAREKRAAARCQPVPLASGRGSTGLAHGIGWSPASCSTQEAGSHERFWNLIGRAMDFPMGILFLEWGKPSFVGRP